MLMILGGQRLSYKFILTLNSLVALLSNLSIFTPQLAGKARQLGCPKIVLDHVHVLLYI